MKPTSSSKRTSKAVKEIRPEYHFDYSRAKPNRFAGHLEKDALVVILDPDVAEVFTTPEAVNTALRALITAMPIKPKRKLARKETTAV
jgi:hypothetical protein